MCENLFYEFEDNIEDNTEDNTEDTRQMKKHI